MKPVLDQRGQGLTEYIILMMLIAVISITAAKTMGKTIRGKIEDAEKRIKSDVVWN